MGPQAVAPLPLHRALSGCCQDMVTFFLLLICRISVLCGNNKLSPLCTPPADCPLSAAVCANVQGLGPRRVSPYSTAPGLQRALSWALSRKALKWTFLCLHPALSLFCSVVLFIFNFPCWHWTSELPSQMAFQGLFTNEVTLVLGLL